MNVAPFALEARNLLNRPHVEDLLFVDALAAHAVVNCKYRIEMASSSNSSGARVQACVCDTDCPHH